MLGQNVIEDSVELNALFRGNEMMKKIDYVIQTLSPVNFAEKSTDSIVYETKKYVPGSAVRGALASLYITKNNLVDAHKDDLFCKMFLEDKIRFLPAYPVVASDGEDTYSSVLPLSLMMSKDGQNVYDLASGCEPKAGYKKVSGMVCKYNGMNYMVDAKYHIAFHMSRNDEKERIAGKSINGKIYNYEYLDPRQYFKGSIIIDDDIAEEFYGYINNYDGADISLGRAKNSQYGKCRLHISELNNMRTDIPDMKKAVYLYALTPYIPNGSWQHITEVSKFVLDDIKELSGIENIGTEEDIFANKEEVNGYVGVWNSKRERVMAMSAGSLFRINLQNNTDIKSLNEVLHMGLGERVNDGYGQFRLVNPIEEFKLAKYVKPLKQIALAEEVKKKAVQIVQARILLEVRKEAMKTALETQTSGNDRNVHIMKRIESLMNSTFTKDEIQNILENEFKSKAKENLNNIEVRRYKLYERLVQKEENTGCHIEHPYKDVKWEDRLEIGNLKESLENDLGQDVFEVNEDIIYRTFWLWFARHYVKKPVGKPNTGNFNNSKGKQAMRKGARR